MALVLIDLDHFKDVNDTFGHAAGDRILVDMATRLRRSIRPQDVLARLGGDEFLILCPGAGLPAEIAKIHSNIRAVTTQPVLLEGNEIRMTATLGVSLCPEDGADFEVLLRNADLAMYAAKDSGRDAMLFYQPQMRQALQERTRLEAELRQALERREFVPYYQPRVDVASGQIVGAEALVRWQHPRRGLLLPAEFISLCEAMRFINALDQQMFEAVAEQQAAWLAAGIDLQVSINLSGAELGDLQLLPELAATLARTGCTPSRLQVEITESMLLSGDSRVLQTMQGIRDLGMSIALDDFGTGYSNLAYLQRFPIQTLKIDRTFIQGLDKDLPVTELIVNLCRLMKLDVVAEGVETQDQLDWITRQGVKQYQGFLCAPALPAAQFEALLRAGLAGPLHPPAQ
jgi:diguanylate cyclase (GGDEF)-like protein